MVRDPFFFSDPLLMSLVLESLVPILKPSIKVNISNRYPVTCLMDRRLRQISSIFRRIKDGTFLKRLLLTHELQVPFNKVQSCWRWVFILFDQWFSRVY